MITKLKRKRHVSLNTQDDTGTIQIIVRLVNGDGPVKGNRSWSLQVADAKVSKVAEVITKIVEES